MWVKPAEVLISLPLWQTELQNEFFTIQSRYGIGAIERDAIRYHYATKHNSECTSIVHNVGGEAMARVPCWAACSTASSARWYVQGQLTLSIVSDISFLVFKRVICVVDRLG